MLQAQANKLFEACCDGHLQEVEAVFNGCKTEEETQTLLQMQSNSWEDYRELVRESLLPPWPVELTQRPQTLLQSAAREGQNAVVKYLIDKKADVNVQANRHHVSHNCWCSYEVGCCH
jgi:hypothetical protein